MKGGRCAQLQWELSLSSGVRRVPTHSETHSQCDLPCNDKRICGSLNPWLCKYVLIVMLSFVNAVWLLQHAHKKGNSRREVKQVSRRTFLHATHSSAVLTRLSLLYNYTSAPPRSRDFREDEYEVTGKQGRERLNTYCMEYGRRYNLYKHAPALLI